MLCWSIFDAADRARISVRSLRRLIDAGQGPEVIRSHRQEFCPQESFASWLKAREAAPSVAPSAPPVAPVGRHHPADPPVRAVPSSHSNT